MAMRNGAFVFAATLGASYAGAIAGAAFGALLAWSSMTGYEIEATAFGAILGILAGVAIRDLRAGVPVLDRLGRRAGLVAGVIGSLFAAAFAAHASRRDALAGWGLVLAGPALAAAMACACHGALHVRPLRWLASLVGAAALGLLAFDVAVLGATISNNTAGLRLPEWLYAYWSWGWTSSPTVKQMMFLAALPAIGLARMAVRERFGERIALHVADVLLAVGFLAWTYRLTALVLVAVVSLAMLVTPAALASPAARWASRAAFVVLCLAPVDVTVRAGVRPAHFAPAVSGLLTGSAFEAADRGEIVVVGGCSSVYNEPRWMWVW